MGDLVTGFFDLIAVIAVFVGFMVTMIVWVMAKHPEIKDKSPKAKS